MSCRAGKFGKLSRCIGIFAALALFLFYGPVVVAGEQPTEAQILNALKSPAKTRGLGGATRSIQLGDPNLSEQRQFIDGLRNRSTRSLTIEERQKVAVIAQSRPSIDLEINFDYNSATIGPKAVPILVALGRALTKDELKGTVFLINGHTDAKGSAEYNQDLSERRAEAVKRLLVDQFGLPPTTLVAVGYGKTHLKNQEDPFGGENRRVQIVNTEVK